MIARLLVCCLMMLGATDTEPLANWERAVGTALENKGVAQLERLGKEWVLNVMCNGTHATYLSPTAVDPASVGTSYVRARYHYVTSTLRDPKCVQGPCAPVVERRIALDRLTRLNVSAADVKAANETCASPTVPRSRRIRLE